MLTELLAKALELIPPFALICIGIVFMMIVDALFKQRRSK